MPGREEGSQGVCGFFVPYVEHDSLVLATGVGWIASRSWSWEHEMHAEIRLYIF